MLNTNSVITGMQEVDGIDDIVNYTVSEKERPVAFLL